MSEVIEPSELTLRKYGLSRSRYRQLLAAQGNACGVCGRVPKSGRLCIDHEHAKGWRHMPDAERARYVRGICCFWCNSRFLARGMTPEIARNIATYLENYEKRRPGERAPVARSARAA